MSSERIIDLVFSRGDPKSGRRVLLASLGAISCYAAGSGLLLSSEQFLAEWSQMLSGRIATSLDRMLVVERMSPPAIARRIEQPLPQTPPAVEARAPVRREVAHAPVRQPELAQAASIIARELEPSKTVDLTGNTFVTGMGTIYGGGLTRSTGTSQAAVRSSRSTTNNSNAPRTPSPPPRDADESRPIGLPKPAWSCPWPVEGDTEAVNEQTAIIQVTVGPDGSVERAIVLVDPGYGFGDAAKRCALASRFVPARDRLGQPTRAMSRPIRVRFAR